MSRLRSFPGKLNAVHFLFSEYFTVPVVNISHKNCIVHFSTVEGNETKKKECCRTLGLSENYTSSELRNHFLKLAKIYHPDSDSQEADGEKFSKIEDAYKFLRKLNKVEENHEYNDVYRILEKDFGIKHTVPQHRQYLNFGGVGIGSPREREKAYQLKRVDKATQNVFEHRLKKVSVSPEKQLINRDAALARQYKSRQAMERLVEDLIQASMARGEFDNLPGSGKPLKSSPENPYVDSTTHKLNQILISNGFTPEWIVLQKEIKDDRQFFRDVLRKRRASLGKAPINERRAHEWISTLMDLKEGVVKLNARINKFNMIVPTLNKQQIHFDLESEARKILVEDPQPCTDTKNNKSCS